MVPVENRGKYKQRMDAVKTVGYFVSYDGLWFYF